MLTTKLNELAKQVEELSKRVEYLEAATPIRPILPQPSQPGWFGNCPKCGLQLNKVMSYTCNDPHCPCGMGPAMCNVTGG